MTLSFASSGGGVYFDGALVDRTKRPFSLKMKSGLPDAIRATLAQMHKAKQETGIMIRRLICNFLPGKFDCDDGNEFIAADTLASLSVAGTH
jgi:hypothetical protein